MIDSKTCIICRKIKSKQDFNIEHIIPESIGNKKLIIHSVCKDCNSRLGKKVDYEITNNIVSELARFSHKIKGKSGKIPNPFRKGITANGRIVYCDEDIKPRFEPEVKFNEETGMCNISAGSLEEAINIANKKLKRLGKPILTESQIDNLRDTVNIKKEQPEIKITTSVDFYKIQMAFIKIAYEFMHYIIGDKYLEDSHGKRLSKILYDYIYNDKKANLDGILGQLPIKECKRIINNFKFLGKEIFNNENIHYVQLLKNKDISIVNIIIFSSFNYSVVVSNGNYEFVSNMYLINPISGEYIKG
ncbi:HNH endonuclease [Alkaliphilus sp. MSJ-5]|uniref:HNH endonuclease n=1 Tax=Alkaliphilus flagellatus TaxID=2841507 RepID=A0ABS6G6Y8_9FIRM|nr:HNH endonuclease [Alkaliphilus flagellatus]MBU5677921.1 HNH endonuclease [Alkaliphilus flagellatus]